MGRCKEEIRMATLCLLGDPASSLCGDQTTLEEKKTIILVLHRGPTKKEEVKNICIGLPCRLQICAHPTRYSAIFAATVIITSHFFSSLPSPFFLLLY